VGVLRLLQGQKKSGGRYWGRYEGQGQGQEAWGVAGGSSGCAANGKRRCQLVSLSHSAPLIP